MKLEDRIEKEVKDALKARDQVKVSTLRMLKSDINKFRLDENKKSLTEEDIIKIVKRHVKQHKDSIEQFDKGNRQDLVDKEKKELEILITYMPEEIPAEELKQIVEEIIKETGATSKKDMGHVMKQVMERVKGRADGKMVSQLVSGLLS